MRDRKHKIKNYNELGKPQTYLLAESRIFRLLAFFIASLIFALLIYTADRIYYKTEVYIYLPFWALLAELFFIPGFLQLQILRDFAKDQANNPDRPTRSLRIVYKRESQRKRKLLKKVFGPNAEPKELADRLMDEWEWQKTTLRKILLSRGILARNFFRLPSSTVYLAYFGIVVGGIITFSTALIQETDHFQSLPQIASLAKAMFYDALEYGLILFIAIVFLIPAIWNGLRNSGLTILETIDDDYLSEKTFFTFIAEMLDLHDANTPRLRLRTAARVYWSIRILTTPLSRLGRVIHQARKSGRIGRLRRAQRHTAL